MFYQPLIALLLLPALQAGAQSGRQISLLANGLTVILRPIPGAQRACLAVLYKIGPLRAWDWTQNHS